MSEISFNLKIGGNKRRIIFDSMTGGRSQYRTNDMEVQRGIEGLEQFGSIIEVKEIIEEESDKEKGKVANDSFGGGEGSSGLEGEKYSQGKNGGEPKDIQEGIISFAEAKEYLITKGCDKTIRSKDNILAYAQELGVEFPNLK
ncbi:hypothetical protein [Bacteroides sp.]|uniref:hypothetical protein n=1 Tax=Bacteroides sp. TaxID=29523 RepID=UPI002620EDE7|nr:hypothetical protein [Bacteroides sp.]